MLSILVPTYNRARLLGETIADALASMDRDDELIIRDNASTDGSQALLEAIAATDSRIVLVLARSNTGPVDNWLTCLSLAKGRHIKLLFSDDLVLPSRFRAFRTAFETSGSAVGFSAALIGTDLRSAQPEFCLGDGPVLSSRDFLQATFRKLGRVPVSPSAFIFEREGLVQSFDAAVAMMRDLPEAAATGAGIDLLIVALAVQRSGDTYYSPIPHVFFRQHADSISTEKSALVKHLYNVSRSRLARLLYGVGAAAPLMACYRAADAMRGARRRARAMVRSGAVPQGGDS